ncbi:BamA/TamA family outer membrane protein [Xylophilus rhododendri]|uniref:BamA/TamA family outer membrane protein n=1 Tax=Xylophilus rhododendri TaxID=2697032 RepID=A0A857JC47_9BURK|nr:BamA/TamA family outer membrane protein [Xylophilus rhododendri]QHJ01581.1 BamA/TamA family outer membrane protein [Xylophilus rhododendri]
MPGAKEKAQAEAAAESPPGDRVLSSGEALQAAQANARKPAGEARREAFTLDVRAPDEIRDYLNLHLELQRYRQLQDLDGQELSRLLGAAEANTRDLLGTLGYFAPRISVDLRETPADARAPREVAIAVDPGERTRIAQVDIGFAGNIADNPAAAVQRRDVTTGWGLRSGQPFTQDAWDSAKTAGLRRITARRYPTASVASSSADVDADTSQARLAVTYDSGPPYRFGPVQVKGAERYPPEVAQRLSLLPVGAEYDQAALLTAQQRLAASGYYDSVFLTLDTDAGTPQAAPVIAQVRDAKLQKIVFGVGASTDSGPRLSVDHIHNQLPLIGWRAVSKVSIDQKTKLISSEQTSLPDDNLWRWVTSERLQRELTGSYEVNSGRLRGGRAKSTDHIDRGYYLQYDYATTTNGDADAPPSGSAISTPWNWTGRYFDNPTAPSRGYGVAVEAGPGMTLIGDRAPFLRSYARGLAFLPLDKLQADGSPARSGRLQFRAEAGMVNVKDSATVPATLLFLTGGDSTVRGYSYRQIGARTVDGQIYAGKYLAAGSVEWQRPIVWNGEMTEFESALFIDAGAVADQPGDLKAKVGVGAGVRWRSPVGPLQADVAYGVDPKKFRLHLRLGFTF